MYQDIYAKVKLVNSKITVISCMFFLIFKSLEYEFLDDTMHREFHCLIIKLCKRCTTKITYLSIKITITPEHEGAK